MYKGRTLQDLAAEIKRQENVRKDFIAPSEEIGFRIDNKKVQMYLGKFRKAENIPPVFDVNDLAHSQFADHLKIPQKYYDRMRAEAPDLLAENVNKWLGMSDDKRLIRTLDGTARAFLSDRYRPLDNFDLVEAVIPVLEEQNIQVVSCEVTEKRLYLKAVDPAIERDIPKGAKMGDGSHHIFDTICPAMTISNSEVGCGALAVEVGTLTKACTNLMFFSQMGMRKYHVGGRQDLGEDLYRLLGSATKKAIDKALWMQVRDVVRNAFDEARFDALAAQLKETTQEKITGDPVKVVEVAAKKLSFNDGQRGQVLRRLIEGANLSRYGLMNAVTRAAEDAGDYEEATAMEKAGGQVVELSSRDWKEIAEAA
jgi:hypothetical protein